MNFFKEFKGIVWPSKKKVTKEFFIVFISTMIGIFIISGINFCTLQLLEMITKLF